MQDPKKREIDVLRRIVFELGADFLASLAETMEDDQEAVDYLHWLIRRREML